ncbi:hypothetical protein HBA55_12105 [Pseudomaricurvus alkylphenolicus]|uniref:hypothetical protein n=1 Tax=Pseudomaricurvus alkylphenolicus TaxID=1306991 RepID=UPI00141FDF88|nr:hypothetical protein [Pseudomaricurvus alkylphenolicus]NIB40333.1 hypothetical protein [Pseudomaricurvus alkylphenolicus]
MKLLANFEQLMSDAREGQATDINTRIQYRYESAAVPDACLAEVLELQKNMWRLHHFYQQSAAALCAGYRMSRVERSRGRLRD